MSEKGKCLTRTQTYFPSPRRSAEGQVPHLRHSALSLQSKHDSSQSCGHSGAVGGGGHPTPLGNSNNSGGRDTFAIGGTNMRVRVLPAGGLQQARGRARRRRESKNVESINIERNINLPPPAPIISKVASTKYLRVLHRGERE